MPFSTLDLTSVSKPTPGFKTLDFSTPTEPTPTPQPSFMDKVIGMGNNVISALTQAPAQKSWNMQPALKAGWDTLSDTAQDTAKRISDAGETLNSNAPILDKVTAEGKVAVGLVNSAFAGITAPLNAARGIPVVGYVADGVNNFFGALGVGGAGYATLAVDALPFSDKVKETIRPLAEEVGALIAQTKGGELVHSKATELVDKSKQLTEAVKTGIDEARANPQLVEQAMKPTPGFKPLDVKGTSVETPVDISKFTPPEQLPTIEAGPPAKSELPTIQTEAPPSTKLGDLTVEPIKSPYQSEVAPKVLESKTPTLSEKSTVSPSTEIKPAETTSQSDTLGSKTSGIAERINTHAIESGLTKSGYDELATYEGTTREAQAKALKETYDKGLDHVTSILRGSEPLPENLRAGALVRYTEQFIKDNPKDPNIADLSHALANSKHTGFYSQAGSDLSSGSGFAESASGKAQAIKKAQEARVGEKRIAAQRKEVATITKKVNLGPEDLGKIDKFIESLIC